MTPDGIPPWALELAKYVVGGGAGTVAYRMFEFYRRSKQDGDETKNRYVEVAGRLQDAANHAVEIALKAKDQELEALDRKVRNLEAKTQELEKAHEDCQRENRELSKRIDDLLERLAQSGLGTAQESVVRQTPAPRHRRANSKP